MIALILIVLVALIALFTTIQTLYVESMRLRTRELPAVVYFKEVMEAKLKMRPELGALTFALWKHGCMAAMGVFVMAQVVSEEPLNRFVSLSTVVTHNLRFCPSRTKVPYTTQPGNHTADT